MNLSDLLAAYAALGAAINARDARIATLEQTIASLQAELCDARLSVPDSTHPDAVT